MSLEIQCLFVGQRYMGFVAGSGIPAIIGRFRFLFAKAGAPGTGCAGQKHRRASVRKLSRGPDNAYFATGIRDEILTRLSKILDLKVISRTSTQHYKSAPENLPKIARQLGAAHTLEGSVQKSSAPPR